MIESMLVFLGMYFVTWPALIIIMTLGILSEHRGSRSMAVFFALVGLTISYFFFGIPWSILLAGAGVYLIFGVLWSFYRYRRYTADIVEKNKNSNQAVKDRIIHELHPKQMLGTLTAWIIIWPFSLIENFIGDIITGIETLVKKVFRSVYNKIYESAVDQLK